VNLIQVGARLPRRVAQEFEVQAGRSELGHGRDDSTQAGIRCVKRRKKDQRESSECRHFRSTRSYTGAEGGRKEEEGKRSRMGGTALRLTRIAVVRSITGSQRAPAPARWVVAVFESCMLTMGTKGGMGLRELAIPVVCGISTSTKLGLLIR
jgi:hypothetical protein